MNSEPKSCDDASASFFQAPVHYSTTVRENIALGYAGSFADHEAIRQAARDSGAAEVVAKLPGGYENLLGRWFQDGRAKRWGMAKNRLARAFLRYAPILLLDEPTSAMDSWAEADWLDRFHQLADGRTAIIITHRLNTAMHADVIHVMNEGRIRDTRPVPGVDRPVCGVMGKNQRWISQISTEST